MAMVGQGRAEVQTAQTWLARHGVYVSVPTPLLTIRLGARRPVVNGWLVGSIFVGVLLGVAYQCLQYLPDVRGVEMTESKMLYFLTGSTVVGWWLSVRSRERAVGALPVYPVAWPSWSKHLGGWYIASLLITFAGGAALATAMYFTTSAQTYAWSWLGALGWGAACSAVILVGTWRSPVLAEDAASAAVDTMLRVEDSYLVTPGYFASLIFVDLMTTNRQPREFTWWLVAYAVLAVGTSVVGGLTYRRRNKLPNTTPNGPF